MNAPLRAGACLAHLAGGFLLWSSCFVALYALLSLGCEADGGAGLRPVLLAAWALHLAAIAGLLGLQWTARGTSRLAPPPALRLPALTLTVAALVGTAWIGWPVFAVPACAGSELRSPAPSP